jgi:hypothetical protein
VEHVEAPYDFDNNWQIEMHHPLKWQTKIKELPYRKHIFIIPETACKAKRKIEKYPDMIVLIIK